VCLVLCEKTGILKFLCQRVSKKRFDEIKHHCAELLHVIMHADTDNQKRLGNIQVTHHTHTPPPEAQWVSWP
jgi:hypothetical protein